MPRGPPWTNEEELIILALVQLYRWTWVQQRPYVVRPIHRTQAAMNKQRQRTINLYCAKRVDAMAAAIKSPTTVPMGVFIPDRVARLASEGMPEAEYDAVRHTRTKAPAQGTTTDSREPHQDDPVGQPEPVFMATRPEPAGSGGVHAAPDINRCNNTQESETTPEPVNTSTTTARLTRSQAKHLQSNVSTDDSSAEDIGDKEPAMDQNVRLHSQGTEIATFARTTRSQTAAKLAALSMDADHNSDDSSDTLSSAGSHTLSNASLTSISTIHSFTAKAKRARQRQSKPTSLNTRSKQTTPKSKNPKLSPKSISKTPSTRSTTRSSPIRMVTELLQGSERVASPNQSINRAYLTPISPSA